jgi:hypothetical protein
MTERWTLRISQYSRIIGQGSMKKLFLFIFAIFLSGTCSVHAATVSFDSQTKAVGVNTPFLVSLILTSATPVNAVHIALTLPENVTVSDISNGNSIISFWTTTPHFDPASHTLTLEGIIPGGFSGTKGRLILLTLKASHPGSHQVVSINTTASNLYRNSANATDEPITAENLVLDVSSTNPATSIDIQDTFPPEHFAPAVIRSPGAFDNKWVVVFVAEDKGSGVDHYEVRETPPGLPFFRESIHADRSKSTKHDISTRN